MIGEDILNKAIQFPSKHVCLTGVAPGEDVWESMKSSIEIKFYKKSNITVFQMEFVVVYIG